MNRSLSLGALLAPAVLLVVVSTSGFADVIEDGDVNPQPIAPGDTIPGLTVSAVGPASLAIDQGSTLTSDGSVDVGSRAGASGVLTVTGTASRLTQLNGGFNVGQAQYNPLDPFGGLPNAPSTGVVHVREAGVVTATFAIIGGNSSSQGPGYGASFGLVEVDGAGSTFGATGGLTVGQFGTGTLRVTNGGRLEARSVSVGQNGGADGFLEIAGPGASGAIQDFTFVGQEGTGRMDIAAGAVVDVRHSLFVGFGNPGSGAGTGELRVAGSGTALTVGRGSGTGFNIGSEGADGFLIVEDGAAVTLFDRAPDPGNFTAPGVNLGQGGIGRIDVRSGGRLRLERQDAGNGGPFFHIGGPGFTSGLPGVGEVNVTGAGSLIELAPTQPAAGTSVRVGGPGSSGSMRVRDGGRFDTGGAANGFTAIGFGSGSDGVLEVDRGGSYRSLASTGPLRDGNVTVGISGGTGQVTIGEGGLLETRFLAVGDQQAFAGPDPGTGRLDVLPGGEIRLSGFNGTVPTNAWVANAPNCTGTLTIVGDAARPALLQFDASAGGAFPTLGMGRAVGSTGTLRATGAGARIQIIAPNGSGGAAVGQDGAGIFELLGGATFVGANNMNVGRNPGSTGTLTIAGAGSEVVLDGVITLPGDPFNGGRAGINVGRRGTGTLAVRDGGRLTIRAASIGTSSQTPFVNLGGNAADAGGNGTGVVSGPGAEIRIEGPSGLVSIGRNGTGSLSVLAGGAIRLTNTDGNARVHVARAAGTSGSLVVSGTSSIVDAGSLAAIGLNFDLTNGGSGTATVRDGGMLEADLVRIGTPGRLIGDGLVSGDALLAGGRIEPGLSGTPGTLTLSGALTVSSGTIEIEASSTASDRLEIGGAASITGGTVALVPVSGYAPALGDRLAIASAAGGFTQPLAVAISGLPGGTDGLLVVSGTALTLEVVPAGQGGVTFVVPTPTTSTTTPGPNPATPTTQVVEVVKPFVVRRHSGCAMEAGATGAGWMVPLAALVIVLAVARRRGRATRRCV